MNRLLVVGFLLSACACSDGSHRLQPNAALMKWSWLGGEWDHVATIHGMADNMEFCQTIVSALQRNHVPSLHTEFACSFLSN